MATAAESVQFSNISATTAAFTLRGGAAYALTVHATFGGGNLQLQILAWPAAFPTSLIPSPCAA
jgi:hypothetical protein